MSVTMTTGLRAATKSVFLLLVLVSTAAFAQTCPCYGAFTCQGNCGGSECCNFGCTDYASDPYNCGSCGRSCGSNSTCVGGSCRCVTGTTRSCYSGAFGTQGVGVCVAGTQTCTANAWGTCVGEVTPSAEICNGLDDDCDQRVDNVTGSRAPLSRTCYSGPLGTENVGPCHGGRQLCQSSDGGTPKASYGTCLGEVTPGPTAACRSGDGGSPGPGPDGGSTDAGTGGGACVSGALCYEGPSGTAGVGVCRAGIRQCGDAGSICQGQVLPGPAHCGGQDFNCDGVIDTACPPDQVCANGACVSSFCGGGEFSVPCPTGYDCTSSGSCVASVCGDGGVCAPGSICVLGGCRVPCNGACTSSQTCFNDRCVANDCTSFPCAAGEVCLSSQCKPDPCLTLSCPSPQQCRAGVCEPSCIGVTCPTGQRCGPGGTCQSDPCDAVTCVSPQVCISGTCVNDPCATVTCPPAQVCQGGSCAAAACADVKCPAGAQCALGVCNGGPGGSVDAGRPSAGDAGSDATGVNTKGCGCGSGGELAIALSVLIAARRRRQAVRLQE